MPDDLTRAYELDTSCTNSEISIGFVAAFRVLVRTNMVISPWRAAASPM